MADLIVRAEARADLLDIYSQGVEHFGDEAAQNYMAGIDKAMDRLCEFPLIGPNYPGLRLNVRYLAYRRHHIFYDYDGETVWVVRILHHALDAGRLI
ncbi:MAG: type II toxin-antitoxin system RelE/ParE family toxin [Xanthobacteraceae bacterium]